MEFVKAEKDIRFLVVCYAVLYENIPLGIILGPETEFRIEGTIDTLKVHLPVKPLPAAHGGLPLFSDWSNSHKTILKNPRE
jgi:hypothetical protein